MANALEVENLTVQFGKREVVRNLSFTVARASALAVIGPNGAGKTVLFRTLIGAIQYHGSVRWAPGTRIGYVPQKLDIERDLPITGADFLRAKAAVSGGAVDEIQRALARVGLGTEVLAALIGAMSGGQFQRLMVAFALIGNPNVLLLDEPAAGVDAPGQEQLNEALRRLQQEEAMTVMLISHDLSVVYRYATNVLCLSRDRVNFGPPRTILTPETLYQLYGTAMGFHVHDDSARA